MIEFQDVKRLVCEYITEAELDDHMTGEEAGEFHQQLMEQEDINELVEFLAEELGFDKDYTAYQFVLDCIIKHVDVTPSPKEE